MKDQRYEDWIQWFLEGFWRQYKVKKIHFMFVGVSGWNNDRKRDKNARIRTSRFVLGVTYAWLCMTYAWGSVSTSLGMASPLILPGFACSLFFKLDRCKKPIFLLLNPTQSFAINKDPWSHYFSFRITWRLKTMVKHQSFKEGLFIFLFSLGFVFLLFYYDGR